MIVGGAIANFDVFEAVVGKTEVIQIIRITHLILSSSASIMCLYRSTIVNGKTGTDDRHKDGKRRERQVNRLKYERRYNRKPKKL